MSKIMIDLGNGKYRQLDEINSGLKLQALIEKRTIGMIKSGHKKFSDETGYLEQELVSLVEESQNTNK